MITGTFNGIHDSWVHIIKEIMNKGEENNTEYGNRSKFINGLAIELTNLQPGWHPQDPYCTKNRVEEYKKQFTRDYTKRRVAEAKTDKDKDIIAFKYTYMDRFTKYPNGPRPFDQIDFIQGQLKGGRYESRRLQAITWVPSEDADASNQDPPCLQRIWVYPRPNKTLDVHINYRSWDMFKGYPANLNAILWMVREEFLEPAGYRLNAFRALADNCHVYSEDWDDAKRIIG